MSSPRVAVVFGSDSDWSVMERCVEQLRAFDEDPHVEVMSAHRNPARVGAFAGKAEEDGFEVIIAAAGMSNALAGAIAAHTTPDAEPIQTSRRRMARSRSRRVRLPIASSPNREKR